LFTHAALLSLEEPAVHWMSDPRHDFSHKYGATRTNLAMLTAKFVRASAVDHR